MAIKHTQNLKTTKNMFLSKYYIDTQNKNNNTKSTNNVERKKNHKLFKKLLYVSLLIPKQDHQNIAILWCNSIILFVYKYFLICHITARHLHVI